MWFPYDFSLKVWIKYMISLGLCLPLIHTGTYLQVRRWIDPYIKKKPDLMKVKLGKGFWFFGSTPFKGHWIVKWMPNFIKKALTFIFEPPVYLRLIYFIVGYFLFMHVN